MRESNFISEIMTSLRAQKMWCYKIADSPTSWTRGITRFTPEKPCDIIACSKGRMVAIECKQMKKFEAFGITQVRESQIKNLDAVIAAGGEGYIFLNIRVPAIKDVQKRENRLIILNWMRWKSELEKASLKKKDLLNWTHVTGKDKEFDLTKFAGNLNG